MATDNGRDFDSLTPVEDDSFDDDGDDDWVDAAEIEEEGWSIVGEIRRIEDGLGEYDSRLYEIAVDIGHTRLLWGRTVIDRKVDKAGIEVGDVIGIKNTGETFETERGSGIVFDVRVLDDGGDA